MLMKPLVNLLTANPIVPLILTVATNLRLVSQAMPNLALQDTLYPLRIAMVVVPVQRVVLMLAKLHANMLMLILIVPTATDVISQHHVRMVTRNSAQVEYHKTPTTVVVEHAQ